MSTNLWSGYRNALNLAQRSLVVFVCSLPILSVSFLADNLATTSQAQAEQLESTDFSGLPIVLAARFRVKPERREEFLKLANFAVQETQKEDGVITYRLYEDVKDHNLFIFFEEWKSRRSLNVHLKSSYIKALLDKFPDLVDGDPSIKVYRIQGVDFILGL